MWNQKKKQHLNISILIVFGLITLFVAMSSVMREHSVENPKNTSYLSNGSVVKEIKEMNLKTALDLGLEEARKWSEFAKPVEVLSGDDGDNTVGIRGANGNRYSWSLLFVDEKDSKYYYIKILNGKIISQKEAQGYRFGPIKTTSNIINSDKALEIAIKAYNLKPGQAWAIGYHYMLTQPKNFPIITVFGYSPDGKFSSVEINAETEEVLTSKKKDYDQSGKSTWVNY